MMRAILLLILFSLLLIEDRAAFEGVDGDEPEPFEEIPVVDGVVAPLKEVALIWLST